MAFQAGSRIRPELGNADYSGFARAAEIQASALANLGKQIGEGFEKYQENKQVTAASLAALETLSVARPEAYAQLRDSDKKIGKIIRDTEDGNYKGKNIQLAVGALQTLITSNDAKQASDLTEIKLQELKSGQKEKQINRSALDMAFSASREAETGEINPAALSAAYFDQGGRDPNDLKIIESMQKMKGPNLEAIEVGPFTVLTQDGKFMQSFRDGEEADPSAQRLLEFKLGERKRARKLYEQGNTQEANDILAVNGYEDMFGRPQSAEDAFGPLDPGDPKDPNNDSSDLDKAVLGDPKPFDPDALTGEDKEAYDFAIKNPNAPQSALILRSLRAN